MMIATPPASFAFNGRSFLSSSRFSESVMFYQKKKKPVLTAGVAAALATESSIGPEEVQITQLAFTRTAPSDVQKVLMFSSAKVAVPRKLFCSPPPRTIARAKAISPLV